MLGQMTRQSTQNKAHDRVQGCAQTGQGQIEPGLGLSLLNFFFCQPVFLINFSWLNQLNKIKLVCTHCTYDYKSHIIIKLHLIES